MPTDGIRLRKGDDVVFAAALRRIVTAERRELMNVDLGPRGAGEDPLG